MHICIKLNQCVYYEGSYDVMCSKYRDRKREQETEHSFMNKMYPWKFYIDNREEEEEEEKWWSNAIDR